MAEAILDFIAGVIGEGPILRRLRELLKKLREKGREIIKR